ncbi:MAG: type II toxin-antitoxin system VapC family toxin [Lachnospiraceae bacterium]|nr:type II toxin-antitoxin system VapC family toxin [Lachnospiraceae bacterium]
MMKYHLDTNIIIYALKGTYKEIENHFRSIPFESIVIPRIVVAEIEYGAKKSKNYKQTIEKYNEFINHFEIIDFDEKASRKFGDIRWTLEQEGKQIGPYDLIIASTVLANEGVLVTHNTKEFERIKGLKTEDWTK